MMPKWRPSFFAILFLNMLLVPAHADQNRLDKFIAVQEMIGMVEREEAQFAVILGRYFIEGLEYSANMLTVSPSHSENMVQTNNGFEGYFMFPKEAVHQEAWQGNEIDDRVVRVKLEVRLDDIFMIIGITRAGEQFNLYPN